MCFFVMYVFSCGDWKWGHFKGHCTREYRTGETCGMKLIQANEPIADKCKTCQKIETKQRRYLAEADRVARWERDGSKLTASIEKSKETMAYLLAEMQALEQTRSINAHHLDLAR